MLIRVFIPHRLIIYKMSLESSTRTYLAIFNIFGLLPYTPQMSNLRFFRRKFNLAYITVPVQTFVSIYLASFSIVNLSIDRSLKLFGQTEILFIYLFLLCSICRSLFILRECLWHRTHFCHILKAIQSLQFYFYTKLSHRILNEQFARKYTRKFRLVIGLYMQYVIVYAVNGIINKYINSVGIPIRIIQFTTALAYLRILFYMDVLGFHLAQLNVAISHRRENYVISKSIGSNDIQMNLLHYKTIHFRLCELAQQISNMFGYSLMAILLETFLSITYSAYWLFEEMHRNSSFLRLPRKYSNHIFEK